MTSQTLLNDYFANHWHRKSGNLAHFNKTGLGLVDKIKPTDRVLDVGCGKNPFKGLRHIAKALAPIKPIS